MASARLESSVYVNQAVGEDVARDTAVLNIEVASIYDVRRV